MANGREYELKFDLHPAATEALISHPLLRASLPRRRLDQLTSTYFDTADLALRRKRIALRVRTSALGTTVHTLKSAGRSAVDRDEWEVEDGAARPDLAWLRSTPLKPLFETNALFENLGPRFTVEVNRTTFPLEIDGTVIEAALDNGIIRTKNLSLSVNEFELELKSGSERGVLKLARKLVRDLPLTLSLASKAERGYGVADLSWGQPTKSIAVDLADVKRIGPAFAKIVEACLHTLARNAALVVDSGGKDAEAVHKTRIALRHLRAAIALFRPALRRKRFAAVNNGLKWMSRLLGEARDTDVFQKSMLAFADRRPDQPAGTEHSAGTELLAERMRVQQDEAHEALQAALNTARWRALLLDLLAFSAGGVRRRWRHRRCAPFVRDRLSAHRRDLAHRAKGFATRSPHELHDLRKGAKMLRYDLDLLADLPKLGVKKKALKDTSDTLQVLQQTLGDMHDEVALQAQLGAILHERSGPMGQSTASRNELHAAAERFKASAHATPTALADAHQAARRLRRGSAL